MCCCCCRCRPSRRRPLLRCCRQPPCTRKTRGGRPAARQTTLAARALGTTASERAAAEAAGGCVAPQEGCSRAAQRQLGGAASVALFRSSSLSKDPPLSPFITLLIFCFPCQAPTTLKVNPLDAAFLGTHTSHAPHTHTPLFHPSKPPKQETTLRDAQVAAVG